MRLRHICMLALYLPLLAAAAVAQAYVVNISRGPASLYLRVGDGSGGTFNGGGLGDGGGINRVSVTVPAAVLGNGSNLAMSSDTTQARSSYDNFVFCNVPEQVYVGGYIRRNSSTGGGVLTVTAPANLVNGNGDTIPFTQISWASSGIGDTGAQPFPAGTFSGGTQTVGNFPANTWRESCHTFSYGNDALVPAGTYNGRVTYTLSGP